MRNRNAGRFLRDTVRIAGSIVTRRERIKRESDTMTSALQSIEDDGPAGNNAATAANRRLHVFEAALQNAREAVLTFDSRARIIDANRGAFNLLGYSHDELLKLHLWDLCSDITSENWPNLWEKLNHARRRLIRTVNRRKDGQAHPVFIVLTLVRVADERLGCVTVRDATEFVEMENRLEQERSIFQDILSTIPYFVFWKDRASRYLGCNRAFATSGGLSSPEEIVGKSDFDMPWSRDESENYRADDAAIMASGEPRLHYEETQQQEDGSTVWLETSKVPLRNRDGEIIGILGVYTDISKRKEMESQLREYATELESKNRRLVELNQAAKAATEAKSAFLANMSHEIRTPMTAILGFAQILRESIDDEAQLNALATITRNGEHLLEIINDILDLSKIEQGKMQLEQLECSPVEILTDAQSLMRVRSDEKKLNLVVDYHGAIPQTIRTDPTRLRQILINLVGNAIKFTQAGDVRVTARLLPNAGNGAALQFEVVDSGIGMTAAQIEQLFRPFEQLDSSMTRKYGGTGLGLAISKHLAQALGGDLRVSSVPGKGSTFSLTIATGELDGVAMIRPTGGTAAATRQSPARADATTSLNCRVLLAEDGHDNQRLIGHILKKAGAEVTVTENGKLACRQALAMRDSDTPFDIILMDMQMPVMDGYTATRRLRETGYTGPIIALTAHAMSSDREKCLNAGCDGYLTKPLNRQQLLELIATQIGGSGTVDGCDGESASREPS